MSTGEIKTEQPFFPGAGGSRLFRIPSVYTLKNGSVIAAADMRYEHGHDSPNNLDTLVAVSGNGYSDWGYTVPNHFDDYPDGMTAPESASFIDPVIVQSEKTGRVFLMTDVFPSGGGAMHSAKGTGCFEINGQRNIALTDTHSTDSMDNFEYYISDFDGEFAVVYKKDGTKTEYAVDREYCIYKNGEPLYTEQNGDTGKMIKQNIFYKESVLSVLKTAYIWMRYSDDFGKTWSSPKIISKDVKREDESDHIVCPGRGICTEYNGRERIVICTYTINGDEKEFMSSVYSDDNGETWQRGEVARHAHFVGKTSETQLVNLPDGTLRAFARNRSSYIACADSFDGGRTWTKFRADLKLAGNSNCMVSAVNYPYKVDGGDMILASFCSVRRRRVDGVIRVGFVKKDKIKWKHKYHVNSGFYAYSCLTVLPDGNIALLCEKEDNKLIEYAVYTVDGRGELNEINGNDEVYPKKNILYVLKEFCLCSRDRLLKIFGLI